MADLFLFYAQNSILFFYDQFVYYNSLRYGVRRPPIEMIYKCFFFLYLNYIFNMTRAYAWRAQCTHASSSAATAAKQNKTKRIPFDCKSFALATSYFTVLRCPRARFFLLWVLYFNFARSTFVAARVLRMRLSACIYQTVYIHKGC